VRVISYLFQPRIQNRRRKQSVLYQIFSQLQNQANNGSGSNSHSGNKSNQRSNRGPNQRKNLDDIEEADFEDVTDEGKQSN